MQKLGVRKVVRHQMLALDLLKYEIDTNVVMDKLIAHGFSRDLAEWIVFNVREEAERYREKELEEDKEPSVLELAAKVLVWSLAIILMMEIAAVVQRTNSLQLTILIGPAFMIAMVVGVISIFSAVGELWDRWKTRRLLK